MNKYNMRHYHKFEIIDRKAKMLSHFPIAGNRNFEANEWSVEIGLSLKANVRQCIGPLTKNDLKRLRRVINRAIKMIDR